MATSPLSDTNDAVHPPKLTMAPIGKPVKSVNELGLSFSPASTSLSAMLGSWCGCHIPSSAMVTVDANAKHKEANFFIIIILKS